MKYELAQFIPKLVITLIGMLFFGFFLVKLWRMDLDFSTTASPSRIVEDVTNKALSTLHAREPDAIYQSGKIVARTTGETVSELNEVIKFDEIYQSNGLDLNSPFEFRKWRIEFVHAGTMTQLKINAPQKGKILETVKCKIVGTR